MFPEVANQETHRLVSSGLLALSGGLRRRRESPDYLEGFVSEGAGVTGVHHLLQTHHHQNGTSGWDRGSGSRAPGVQETLGKAQGEPKGFKQIGRASCRERV